MELLIPFMLFILDLREQTQPELSRHPVVYADEKDCQEAGTAIMADRQATGGETRFWCMPTPSNEEFSVLMKQIEADHVARREARNAMKPKPELTPQP